MANVLSGGYVPTPGGGWAFSGQWSDPAAEAEERASRARDTTQGAIARTNALSALQQAYAQQGYLATFDEMPGALFPGTKPASLAPKLTRLETSEDRNRQLAEKQFELKKGLVNSISGLLANWSTGKSGAAAPEVTPGPAFTPGPVYSPEQMIAQQNLVRDRSMQQAAGVARRGTAKAGARGFSGNSPLLKALQSNAEISGRVGGEQGALDFSRQADVANAQNLLAGSQLAQERHNAYQQALLNRYQAQISDRNAILSVLGGLAG